MNAKAILARILSDLPANKDWLDPALEAMAREAVKPIKEPVPMGEHSVCTPPAEKLAKLPQWAQDAFRSLSRERDTAVRNLKEWTNDQSPSPVSIQEYVSTGDKQGPEFMTRYFHATDIKINWMGCRLEIMLRKAGNMHEDCIKLQWEAADHEARALAFIPESYQCARIQHPSRIIK